MSLILAIVALATSLIACAAAAYALYDGKGALTRQLRRDVAELADDVDQLHALHHKRARRENMDAARAGKSKGDALLEEAQRVLAAAGSATADTTSSPPAGESKDQLRSRLLVDAKARGLPS